MRHEPVSMRAPVSVILDNLARDAPFNAATLQAEGHGHALRLQPPHQVSARSAT
jgi:hypothetical protein